MLTFATEANRLSNMLISLSIVFPNTSPDLNARIGWMSITPTRGEYRQRQNLTTVTLTTLRRSGNVTCEVTPVEYVKRLQSC